MQRHRAPLLSRKDILFAVAGLAIVLVLLLNLPIAEFITRLQEHGLPRGIVTRRWLLAGVGTAVALLVGTWLVFARRRLLLLGGALAYFVVIETLVVHDFQVRYPNARLFSVQRYGDGLSVLLGTDALLSKFKPAPALHLRRETVDKAAFPAVDVHFHLESLDPSIDADRLVRAMDAAGIAKLVNLGGLPGGMFEHFAETFYKKYPDRFILFAKPDPGALQKPDGVQRDLDWVKKAARMGARGLKESKSFGLSQRDTSGKLVAIDDERLAPVWELAGRLGMPVLIHTGEPAPFWDPVDEHNERYLELLQNPDWSLYGTDAPSREELMRERERLLARHPGTNFIGAHLGMNADDLSYVSHLLDTYPNYYVDMSSVVQDLGRQPYSTREFFIRYQDRILFGTDGGYGLSVSGNGWTPERMYRSYLEFLETPNEYTEYPLAEITKQGEWRVYGIDLPRDVLEKIYSTNAARLIPSHEAVLERLEQLD